METNLVNAYKSLKAVTADPGYAALPGPMKDGVVAMMQSIRAGLIELARIRAISEVDAALA